MSIADEYKQKAIKDGIIRSIFYICGQCKEITESVDYTDKCISCKWQGEFQEASTQENAEKIVKRMKDQGYNSALGTYNQPKESLPEITKTKDELLLDARARSVVRNTKDLKTLMSEGIPETVWLIENMLPKRGLMVIGAEAGSYKTYIVQHMALCISLGKNFLEQFHVQQGGVVYIDEENGQALLMKRFQQLANGHNITEYPSNVNVVIFEGIKLDEPEGKAILEGIINEHHPSVIILDSMVRLMTGEEDKSKDVRKVFDTLKPVMENTETSFVILHHMRKPDAKKGRGNASMTDLRGSSDFPAMADVILMMGNLGKARIKFTMVKNRHIPLDEVQPFEVRVENPTGFEESIKFTYEGMMLKPQSAAERAMTAMENWIKDNRVSSFTRKQTHDQLRNLGHSKRAVDDAIDLLLENGFLKKKGLGEYDVVKGFLFVEEELTHE